MDQAWPRFVPLHEGIEQAVDMLVRLAAALGCKAWWLVEDDRALGLFDHHGLRLGNLFGRQFAARLGRFTAFLLAARRNA